MQPEMAVYLDDALASYGFGANHPFGNDRFFAFRDAFLKQKLDKRVGLLRGERAREDEIVRFHTKHYVAFVKKMSALGEGFLDYGDTPAILGIFESASYVVGTTLDATKKIAKGQLKRAFVPIAGLHHARRDRAAGFCVFNDIGVAIETLRAVHGVKTIAYVDIDVHHGDGVYYGFEEDPDLIFADIHEEGNYPGTGESFESGVGSGKGKKLNIPVPRGSDDDVFFEKFDEVLKFVDAHSPEFIIFQCGADSLKNDLLGGLWYSKKAHAYAAKKLRLMADQHAKGRMLALGGGGYNLKNIEDAWISVVSEMV